MNTGSGRRVRAYSRHAVLVGLGVALTIASATRPAMPAGSRVDGSPGPLPPRLSGSVQGAEDSAGALLHFSPAVHSSSEELRDADGQFLESDVRVSTPAAQDFDEPSVAINPRDPNHLVLVAQDYNYWMLGTAAIRGFRTFVSFDGGRTWDDRGFLDLRKITGDSDTPAGVDPVVAFGPKGDVYFSFIAAALGADATNGLAVARSPDGGRSWKKPAFIPRVVGPEGENDCGSFDKNWHTVDPRTGTIFLTWTHYMAGCGPSGDWGGQPIYLSKSDDKGKTFSKPVRVSPEGHDYAQGARPVIGPDGTLYVTYMDFPALSAESACPTIYSGNAGDARTAAVMVSVSTDRGLNWNHHRLAYACDLFGAVTEYYAAIPTMPSIAVDDRTGVVHVTWADRKIPAPAVSVSTSTDAGSSWSKPLVLPPVPGQGEFFPEVGAANGKVWLFYVGIQPGSGTYDTFIRRSVDAGRNWSDPFRLSTASSWDCGDTVPDAGTQTPRFIGHYMNLAVAGDKVVPAWVDCRDRRTDGTQIFVRPSR